MHNGIKVDNKGGVMVGAFVRFYEAFQLFSRCSEYEYVRVGESGIAVFFVDYGTDAVAVLRVVDGFRQG